MRIDIDIFLSSLYSSLRALIFGIFGIYFQRLGIFSEQTKQDVSQMIFRVMVPVLLFISVGGSGASKSDVAAESHPWVLFISPFFHIGIGVLVQYVITRFYRPKAYIHSLLVSSVINNNLGLPLVLLTGMCESINPYSALFSSKTTCLNSSTATVAKYSVFTPIMLWVVAKEMIGRDKPKQQQQNSEEETSIKSKSGEYQISTKLAPVQNEQLSLEIPSSMVNDSSESSKDEDLDRRISASTFNHRKAEVLNLIRIWAPRIINPPVIGIILGLIIGSIPPVRNFIFDSAPGSAMEVLVSSLDTIGVTSIPFTLFVLGSSLSKGPKQNSIPFPHILLVVLTKLVILPAIFFAFIILLRSTNFFSAESVGDSRMLFVMLLESCMPAAMSITILAQLQGFGQSEISSILFFHYVAATITVTLWISVFLSWIA